MVCRLQWYLSIMHNTSMKIMGSHQVALWLGLNLLDLVLSIIALEYGKANEFSMLRFFLKKIGKTPYYDPSSYVWFGLWKMGLAVCVPFILAWAKRLKLIKWLNIGLGGICLYITVMLIKTFS